MLKINQREMQRFKQSLAQKLLEACAVEGVNEARSNTPIWSQRLHDSARAEMGRITRDRITVDIVFGGLSLPGVREEIGIKKDVDYSLDVELRSPYLRSNLGNIADAIVDGLHR